MIELAKALAVALDERGVPVFASQKGFTESHQFALEAARYGGGQKVSKTLRESGFLACGIGLPVDAVAGDMNGLRIGTPELARWGVTADHAEKLADYIAGALSGEQGLAGKVAEFRQSFKKLCFICV